MPNAPPSHDDHGFEVATSYTLNALNLSVRWATRALAEQGSELLDYLGLQPLVEPARRVDGDLRVLPASAEGPPAVDIPEDARLLARHDSGLCILARDTTFFLRRNSARGRIEPETGRAVMCCPGEAAPDAGSLYLLLAFAVLLLLQERGLYAVHGAGLAKEDPERGVLVVADSDAGKSTLAYSLVRHGWKYLSDDSILLRLRGKRVEALPYRRDFTLDADAADLFPELGDHHRPVPTDPDKWRIPVAKLFPAARLVRCQPMLLLFPQLTDRATSALEPLAPREAYLHLLRQNAVLAAAPHQAQQHLDALRALVGQADCYRLLTGHDVLTAPDQVSTLLAGAHPRS